MKSSDSGKLAEDVAARHLAKNGYQIIAQNWRTGVCEIDIIAEKDQVKFFIEVKYRRQSRQGEGLEYITPAKFRQMEFAVAVWCQENDWDGDCRLLVASVDGHPSAKIDIIEV